MCEREISRVSGLGYYRERERERLGFRCLERGRNGLGVLGLKNDREWGLRA